MKRAKAIAKLVSMIVAGANALSANGASAAVGPAPDVPKSPNMTVDDVFTTIERINRNNPTAMLRIQIAQVAGEKELIAAIVQAVSSCSTTVSACVKAAVAQLGLTAANLTSLNELTAALEAINIAPEVIAEALDAYSTEVANAVVAGTIPEQTAATTLAEEASGSLYQ